MSLNEVLFWKKEVAKNRLTVDAEDVLYQGLKMMRVEIFEAAHNQPVAGHMGIKSQYRTRNARLSIWCFDTRD